MAFTSIFLCLLCYAFAAQRSYVEHTTQKSIPDGWTMHTADLSEKIQFILVLNTKQRELLEEKFWAVSDPTSPDYANYMTLNEISSIFGPSKDEVETLKEFFASYGVLENLEFTLSRDFVSASAPVYIAEKIFNVKFHKFTHTVLPSVVRTLEPYTLPTEIAKMVKFVSGIHKFPSPHKLRVKFTDKVRGPFIGEITPQVIWSIFNTSGQKGTNPKNLQGVAQFLDQFFSPSDLAGFQSHFQLSAQPAANVIGPNDPTNPGIEATLDIQYIIGTAPMIPTWFWSTGPPLHGGQEDFVRWAQAMNNATTVPYVMSVSYGDDESTIDKSWADRLNEELQKLALRGVSVLFASGDNGVGCSSSCKQLPNWPASSPYVTAVGGFVGTSSGSLIGDGISSGGFSNFYPMPPYQAAAVTNYLKNGPSLPPSNQFNATSRAMPDVSSFSENVMIYQGGGLFPVAGTSCAAPVFSGVISLINDALLNAGKKPAGFLNPALYNIQASNPSAFIDVTVGKNANGCCTGFTATKGWDPITGLGGPNFPVLKQAFLSLQK